jgi:hypothetical protein
MPPKKKPNEINMHEIDVLNDQHIKYWMEKLHITEKQLRTAVFIAGKSVDKMIAYLKKVGHINPDNP